MTDDTHLATRRNALKGLAAFAGTSAVGAGAILHASEPARATSHVLSIDDITVEVIEEVGSVVRLNALGISDLWFDVTWENIEGDINARFALSAGPEMGPWVVMDDVDLGVDGEGTETFGFGDAYADLYTVDLNGPAFFDGATPLAVTPATPGPDTDSFMDNYDLSFAEGEKTVTTFFGITLVHLDENGFSDSGHLATPISEFDVTVERVEPGSDVSDGEGEAYGEG